jgi:SUN domain-containing protein 1/2
MMQVQLDLVDMKIHKEIDGLRREIEDKIDEQATSFGTELRNMKARTEDIEASLKMFIDAGFPTKHEVLELITSMVEQRAVEGSGDALSLDDVRAVARRIVEVELDKHASDGIGRVDYALASGGGKV